MSALSAASPHVAGFPACLSHGAIQDTVTCCNGRHTLVACGTCSPGFHQRMARRAPLAKLCVWPRELENTHWCSVPTRVGAMAAGPPAHKLKLFGRVSSA
eukprot:scaffold8157_cov141-Isochrysis_galbana.AAC.1